MIPSRVVRIRVAGRSWATTRETGKRHSGAPAKSRNEPKGAAMADDLQSRIDAMYARDKYFAWAFVAALWITVLFVLIAVQSYIPDGDITVVCWIAAFVL